MAETMNSKERIAAAIRLERTGRIPVVPYIDHKFPCRQQGVVQAEAYRDPGKAWQAMADTFDALGGYDATFWPGVGSYLEWSLGQGPMKIERPGRELPEEAVLQMHEEELITAEDYDRLIEVGWKQFVGELYTRVWQRPLEMIERRREMWLDQAVSDIKAWADKGVPTLTGASVYSPLMALSCSRTVTQFTLDLYRRPDKVAAAMDAMVGDLIDYTLYVVGRTGIPCVGVILERGSGFYYPLKFFERFELPYLKQMVEAFVAKGITPVLHFDTNWIINLPYLKELPKGKCVCELDSTTDIFKAKEILRGHMCIMGDVPASLLAVGTTQQVEDYCKRLVDVIGDGGGFILSTGCVCPIDARFDNVKTMLDTAKGYLP